jgi:hypothetical protein
MSDDSESTEKKGFQVVDKRRFDSGGNERTEPAPNKTASDTTQQIAGDFRMESSDTGAPEVNFSSFVMSLATQAMVQLGQMPSPEGMEIPVDIESGKGTIDILGMIQQKTLGNLSKEEARFLEDVLHTLRVSYIRLGQSKGAT